MPPSDQADSEPITNFRLSFSEVRRYKKRIRKRLDKHDRVPVVRVERMKVKECVYYGLLDAEEIDSSLWDSLKELPRAKNSIALAGAAELTGGQIEECVLFVTEEDAWEDSFLYDMLQIGASFLRLSEVKSILRSPNRLPVHIEEKMNEVEETHMGGMVVNFILKDGTKFGHSSGSANLSFVSSPEGVSSEGIVDVEFGNDPKFVAAEIQLNAPNYKWCVFNPPTAIGQFTEAP
ncbi:MAG: hypothetical protein ACW99U_21515 [Candidatus Thorarchaeota archaeon]